MRVQDCRSGRVTHGQGVRYSEQGTPFFDETIYQVGAKFYRGGTDARILEEERVGSSN